MDTGFLSLVVVLHMLQTNHSSKKRPDISPLELPCLFKLPDIGYPELPIIWLSMSFPIWFFVNLSIMAFMSFPLYSPNKLPDMVLCELPD
ncbi:Cephamycin export CmcT [Gossypium arboreum]|uniref:Cephamycin export CmcT n=1 Tax=Gossypium arboreum TaxID=29729 RepID=A0A0B0PND6_GOSAR|nr:Cephamycin export CmcT [Gossypium arboreum]